MKTIVAVTGASGTIYAVRLVEKLTGLPQVERIAVVVSRNGESVGEYEIGAGFLDAWRNDPKVEFYANDDMFAPIASGSAVYDAMVIVPCSMGTIGRIAAGISDSLIARAADVTLKERKRLIVVPRESPLSLIHLENLAALTRTGAVVMPASPSFYSRPADISELADTLVERILSHLGLEIPGAYHWRENR